MKRSLIMELTFRDSLSIYKSPYEMEFCTEPRSHYGTDPRISHLRSSHSVVLKTNKYIKNIMQHNTIQYNRCNTIQYNTKQYNTMQCNTIQYNTI